MHSCSHHSSINAVTLANTFPGRKYNIKEWRRVKAWGTGTEEGEAEDGLRRYWQENIIGWGEWTSDVKIQGSDERQKVPAWVTRYLLIKLTERRNARGDIGVGLERMKSVSHKYLLSIES